MDGSGWADVLVGAPSSTKGTEAGAAYLVLLEGL